MVMVSTAEVDEEALKCRGRSCKLTSRSQCLIVCDAAPAHIHAKTLVKGGTQGKQVLMVLLSR